jgi:cytochrome P450
MRLRPPAWAIGRTALAEHRAGPHIVAAGSTVVVSPWLLHHDERWWPDPAAFRPERWLDAPERARGAYLPFGAGPRMCIGEPFARLEGVLLLATIARRWRLHLRTGFEPELQPVITLRPRGGMPMLAERRRTDVAPGGVATGAR